MSLQPGMLLNPLPLLAVFNGKLVRTVHMTDTAEVHTIVTIFNALWLHTIPWKRNSTRCRESKRRMCLVRFKLTTSAMLSHIRECFLDQLHSPQTGNKTWILLWWCFCGNLPAVTVATGAVTLGKTSRQQNIDFVTCLWAVLGYRSLWLQG
jgi:hypothetical protein